MSQENVERFRLGLEDFIQASKTEDWDGWLERQDEVWDPEIEWDASNVPMPDLAGVETRRHR